MIEVDWRGRVGVITLNRPDKRNALNISQCEQLRKAVLAALDGGARALVLTGAGTSFCSGADLDAVYSAEFRVALYDMLRTVVDAPVPVIAAVNGPAIGAGTQLAIASDLRVAEPGAVFGVPTAKIGLAVDPWTIRRLSLLAGNGVARSLLLACVQMSAEDALAGGLVDRLGGVEDAVEWAESMVDLAPLTVAYNKRVLNAVFEPDFDVTPGAASSKELFEAFEGCWSSEDFTEGRRAREEKRAPRFQGR
ncbi:MAG TPA: enoyl-CoA hydratase [Pseudonocardia sp.]|jgi:enoyl-CoA hydratase|nr:enoyl-CoA hydratase [Pseudonocardia sp.]